MKPGPESFRHTEASPLHAMQSLLLLIVIAIFTSVFIAQPFEIPSGSMEPTLLIGDFLLVDKHLSTTAVSPLPPAAIRRGDIIVFHYPVDPALHLIKRVIGLPGDRIHLHEGRVWLNDRPLDEPYAFYGPSRPNGFRDDFPRMTSAEPGIESRWWIEMRGRIDRGDLVVPTDRFFVLGDNRNDSEDSRYWGFVPRAAIVGRPFLIYFSLRLRDRTDDPATAHVAAPAVAQGARPKSALLNRLLGIARWQRTLLPIR